MAIDAYMKQAAATLQAAVTAINQEIQEIRHDVDIRRRDIEAHINQLGTKMHEEQTKATQPDKSSFERADHMREVNKLGGEITAKKHEIDQLRAESEQRIKDKENDIVDLQGKARDLVNKI